MTPVRLRRFYDPPWLVGLIAALGAIACGWMAASVAGRPPSAFVDWLLLVLLGLLALYFATLLVLVLLGRMPRWLRR